MTGRALPLLQSTLRMWQILRRCYRLENPVGVLERGLVMLADSDGHLDAAGRIKTGAGGRREVRRPS